MKRILTLTLFSITSTAYAGEVIDLVGKPMDYVIADFKNDSQPVSKFQEIKGGVCITFDAKKTFFQAFFKDGIAVSVGRGYVNECAPVDPCASSQNSDAPLVPFQDLPKVSNFPKVRGF